jgi:eukaryotic-like serine/threonine-protein kinase
MTLAAGTKLGHYDIQAPIGMGGMGEMYRAIGTELRRVAALKVRPEAYAEDQNSLAQFRCEAALLPSRQSPTIAAI